MSLKKINLYAAYLHFLSSVGVSTAFYIRGKRVVFDTGLYRMKITSMGDKDRDITLGVEKYMTVSTKDLEYIISLIFLITGWFHLFYYTDGFNSGAYTRETDNGYNRFRWLEYAITSTMMIYVLAIVNGIKEFDTVVLLCTLNIALMSIGYFLEQSRNKQSKVAALFIGFYILTTMFGILLKTFYDRLDEVEKQGRKIPDWLRGVLVPMFIWYLSFGVVAILNVKNMGKPGYSFKKYEKYYIYLSFLSKAFMGYYITFGITRDESDKS